MTTLAFFNVLPGDALHWKQDGYYTKILAVAHDQVEVAYWPGVGYRVWISAEIFAASVLAGHFRIERKERIIT